MNLNSTRVLVTGGAGFIGSHLVEALVAAGAKVTTVDDLSHGLLKNLATCLRSIDFLKMDMLTPEAQDLIATYQFDVVYHLASNAYVPPSVKDPTTDFRVNLLATFRLLETVRLRSPSTIVVYFSSAAVYGQGTRMPIHEDDPTVPISPYGVSKLAAERYVAVYSHLYGLRAASVRLFSVYGPRQRKQVVYDLIDKIMHDQSELFIHGDGSQVRDFGYVEDIVQAVLLVAEGGRLQGEVYNVASGRQCSVRELAMKLCHILDVQPRFVYSGSVRPGDVEKWTVDISRLTSLGYRPQVPLEEGLRRTVEWFLSSEKCPGEGNGEQIAEVRAGRRLEIQERHYSTDVVR